MGGEASPAVHSTAFLILRACACARVQSKYSSFTTYQKSLVRNWIVSKTVVPAATFRSVMKVRGELRGGAGRACVLLPPDAHAGHRHDDTLKHPTRRRLLPDWPLTCSRRIPAGWSRWCITCAPG